MIVSVTMLTDHAIKVSNLKISVCKFAIIEMDHLAKGCDFNHLNFFKVFLCKKKNVVKICNIL